MRDFKIKLVCLLLFLSPAACFSQILQFEQYTTKNGLISDEVYNLLQDKKGYIWAFTNYGALKYNGVNFERVLVNLPFNESFIYCVYENSKGCKWVANSNGKIYRVVNDSAFLVKGIEVESENLRKNVSEISALQVDDSLNIFATTKQYTYKFINKGNTYKALNLSRKIKYDSVVYIVQEKPGGILQIPTFTDIEIPFRFNSKAHVGLVLLKNKQERFYLLNQNAKTGIRHFKRYGACIYFLFDHLLGKIDGEKISFVEMGSTALNFTKDKNGHTWVGCLNGGLHELDEHDSIINHYLDNITINDVLIDTQFGLWASSPGSGLFHCLNLNDRHFDKSDPLGGPIGFLKVIDDHLWISALNGSIYRVKDQKINLVRKNDDHDEGLDIIKSGDNFYVSYKFKLIKIHVPGNHPQSPAVLCSTVAVNALKIHEVNKDSLIYLHRRGIGVLVNEDIKKRLDLKNKNFSFAYRSKELFLATDKGVYIYSKTMPPDPVKGVKGEFPIVTDTVIQSRFLSPTRHSIINNIVKDKYDNLWFCSTGNGLFVLNKKNKLRHFTIYDSLPSNIINSVSFNSDGSLLMSTNTGLYWFNSSGFAFNPLKSKCLYHGNVKNGVLFENTIYVATSTGLVILDPAKITSGESIYFNLRSITVNGKAINSNGPRVFKYYENNPEFKFDVISFSDNTIPLNYLLHGPASDSGQVSARSLNFQNLKPGNYSLVVFPEISGSTRRVGIETSFVIIPAFWQTLPFYFAVAVILAALFIYAAWLIFKAQRRKNEKRSQSEKLILEYKLIALKAQINPHFMSNCLTAIQHLIINNHLDEATAYIGKFGLLVRQILNFSTRTLVPLKDEIEITRLNIELEQLRFKNKFLFEINVDSQLDVGDLQVPALILNPIIENAIWHGLLPIKDERPGKLLVKIEAAAGGFSISVEDNGIGRQKTTRNPGNLRESKGIDLTEQRLKNINYMYHTDVAKMLFTDLKDENNVATGTRVTISLPLIYNE